MNRQLFAVAAAAIVAWAGVAHAQTRGPENQKYPDVVSVKVQARSEHRFDFDVTISSPYDTPQRYADAFRVVSADGRSYGERKLFHDHASEQPFTRDLYGVAIPSGIQTVIVQARDQKHGYGGKTVKVILPGR
jgi:hypothetical protein